MKINLPDFTRDLWERDPQIIVKALISNYTLDLNQILIALSQKEFKEHLVTKEFIENNHIEDFDKVVVPTSIKPIYLYIPNKKTMDMLKLSLNKLSKSSFLENTIYKVFKERTGLSIQKNDSVNDSDSKYMIDLEEQVAYVPMTVSILDFLSTIINVDLETQTKGNVRDIASVILNTAGFDIDKTVPLSVTYSELSEAFNYFREIVYLYIGRFLTLEETITLNTIGQRAEDFEDLLIKLDTPDNSYLSNKLARLDVITTKNIFYIIKNRGVRYTPPEKI